MLLLAPFGWGQGLTHGGRESSILASVVDVLRPKLAAWFINTAGTTGIRVDSAVLARGHRMAIGAGQPAVLTAIGDVSWPEASTRLLQGARLASERLDFDGFHLQLECRARLAR